jgi:hypothetical protein
MRHPHGEFKRAFKDARRNTAMRLSGQTDATGRVGEPPARRAWPADRRTVMYAPPATRPPVSPAAAIYDLNCDPLKDFALVAPCPDVSEVLELAS